MYAVHTTPGFIVESRPRGDAGKSIFIFTRDLGLVMASAQGIRLEKSKLRYHAQDYALGIFSLVKGKEFWRLTSAQPSAEPAPPNAVYSYISSRLATLLRRLVPGEEPHPELFGLVEACLRFAQRAGELDAQRLQAFESVAVFCALRALGYIPSTPTLGPVAPPASLADIDAAIGQRPALNGYINTALRESHL